MSSALPRQRSRYELEQRIARLEDAIENLVEGVYLDAQQLGHDISGTLVYDMRRALDLAEDRDPLTGRLRV